MSRKSTTALAKRALTVLSAFALAVVPMTTTAYAAPSVAEVNAIGTTNTSTPEYTFYSSEAGLIVYRGACVSDTHYAEVGNNVVTFKALDDGTYNNCAIAVYNDNGMSAEEPVSSFEIDTTAPTLTEVEMFETPVNNTVAAADYIFESDEDGTYEFTGDCNALGTGAVTADVEETVDFTALADDTYSTCKLTVEDAAGNVSNAITFPTFLVDVTFDGSFALMPSPADVFAPATDESSDTFRVSNDTGETLKFYVTEDSALMGGTENCYVPEVSIATGTVGTLTAHYLTGSYGPTGTSSCEIVVEDAAGNTGILSLDDLPADVAVSDSVAPAATLGTTPTSTNDSKITIPVNVSTADVEGSEAAMVYLNGTNCTASGDEYITEASAAVFPGANAVVIAGLSNTETYDDCELEVTDASGNVTVLDVAEFTVNDTTAPTVTIVEKVDSLTTDTTPAFTFSVSEDGTVIGDATILGACSNPANGNSVYANGSEYTTDFQSISPLGNPLNDGIYGNCRIVVEDASGNQGVAVMPAFKVDTTAPVLTAVEGIADPTTDPTPTYTFSSDEAGEVSYVGGAHCAELSLENAVVGNNNTTYSSLLNGTYAACVITVEDAAGNVSAGLAINGFTLNDPADVQLDELTFDTSSLVYSFKSNKPGTIVYSGVCSSTTSEAVAGTNTIQFNWLPTGETFDNCEITVGGETLNIAEFTVGGLNYDAGTVFRFYNPTSEAHFYTADQAEADYLRASNPNWNYEGPVFKAYPYAGACTSGTEVFRFFNPTEVVHFYTADVDEKQYIIDTNPNWDYEAVAYCAMDSTAAGLVPMYQFWSDSRKAHFYTVDAAEKAYVESTMGSIYNYEGVVFYVMPL